MTTLQRHMLTFYLHTTLTYFFFPLSGTHRDLHSFPTRRSSDLGISRGVIPRRSGVKLRAEKFQVSTRPSVRRAGSFSVRSEEHTSELQSHVNLVCRLLLEKKKQKYI